MVLFTIKMRWYQILMLRLIYSLYLKWRLWGALIAARILNNFLFSPAIILSALNVSTEKWLPLFKGTPLNAIVDKSPISIIKRIYFILLKSQQSDHQGNSVDIKIHLFVHPQFRLQKHQKLKFAKIGKGKVN